MQGDDEEGTVARMATNSTEQWPADEGSAELKKGVGRGESQSHTSSLPRPDIRK